MRQRHQPADEAEARGMDLGVTAALWWAVVEQHDSLGYHDGSTGPCDDRGRGNRGEDVEQAKSVHQDPDVAAGDEDRIDAVQEVCQFGTMAFDRRSRW